MQSSSDTFIECHACKAKNASDAANCAQCGTNLLPGRSPVVRLFFGAVALVGIAIPVVMLITLNALPGFIPAVICILLIGFGLPGALSRSPESERLVNRAERHLKISPGQALIDATRAHDRAANNSLRCLATEKKGEALMALGRNTEALAEFRRCQTMQPDNAMAKGVMQNTMKKAQAKMDEIKKMEAQG